MALLFFGALFLLGLLLMKLGDAMDNYQKEKYGEEEYKRMEKVFQDSRNAKKYCNFQVRCPVCNSKHVKKISTANRVASVATLGLASGKIGKQYECDICHHRW